MPGALTDDARAVVCKLETLRLSCLAQGDHAGADQCRAQVAHELTSPGPLEAARLAAAREARQPTDRDLGRYSRVAAQMRRPRMMCRPRQSCGGRRRLGVRRVARANAPPGESDEGEPARGRHEHLTPGRGRR
jgi:hypothetical protein